MTDTFEFTLNNPLTEEQWGMITDVDMDRTDKVTFRTKHGKEVEFTKVRHGKWINYKDEHTCSECGETVTGDWNEENHYDYCPHCGARMVEIKQQVTFLRP